MSMVLQSSIVFTFAAVEPYEYQAIIAEFYLHLYSVYSAMLLLSIQISGMDVDYVRKGELSSYYWLLLLALSKLIAAAAKKRAANF